MHATNRILSALLGLALLLGGLLVVLEMGLIASGREPLWLPLDRWYESLRSARLDGGAFVAAAAIAAIVGVLLLIVELRPWAPQQVRTDAHAGAPLWISRKSVERRVSAAAATAGVSGARSAVRGKPGRWNLRLRGVSWPERRDTVAAAVRTELDRLYAPPDIPVSLALRRPPGRVR